MEIALAAVLLLLVVAVVILFAMVAELAARVPAPADADREPLIGPLDEAHLGEAPTHWPEPFGALPDRGHALLLVLSSSCASCEKVAAQVSTAFDRGELADAAVLVSCGDRAVGEDFARRHGLERMPHYVDGGGSWIRGAFGVQTSPTALVLRDGRLESALVFTDLAALREALASEKEEATV